MDAPAEQTPLSCGNVVRPVMIIAVIAAWTVIGVLLLGVPAAAWWIGGRSRFWRRAEARQVPDLHREMVRRHGLSAAEIPRVTGALTWGRELQDPRLRAAVVDWAQAQRAELVAWRVAHPRLAALRGWLVALWCLVTVAVAVFAVAQDRWGSVPWFAAVYWFTGPVVGFFQHRARDRALALNSGTPAS